MATIFTSLSKKAIFVLLLLVINIISNFAQKGPSKPTNPKKPITSALNCPLVLSIQDNNPTAECSELLKTLVAITSPCTDTTAVSYEWSSSIGGVFSTSRTTTFNLPEFIVATPLTINVIVAEGSDSQSASYTFTIKPRPSRPTISPVGALILCDNNPITLTTTGCAGGSTPIWSNGNAGLSSISVPAIGGSYYKVACEKNGCVSDSTAAVSLIAGIVTSPPTVINRTICEGTTILQGNGLQADIPNCSNGLSGTYTYTGSVVGYDQGYINSGGMDPTVIVPSSPNIIKKVSISITWRKQAGGFQNDCGTGNTLSYPFHNETQFRIKSPSGKIITLINTGTYGGYSNPFVTTIFEDGSSPINFYSPPVSGTFASAQPLSAFIGGNPTGTWTLLPYDNFWRDPLCVSGFSITFSQETQAGEVSWWDAPTGGNLLHTGAEYIPSATSAGVHTFYAQGQCVKGCPSARTATTLTINPRPVAPAIDVNVAEISGIRTICGGQPITLTATGCANDATVKWSGSQNGVNFATGPSYTFTPIFSNSSDINQTFTAVCTGANLCNSLVSNTITLNVKRKPSTPTISGPGSTACINSNITLFASACSGGTLGWTGNRSGSSITFPITTNVDIKVACTVNGCISDSSSVYSITTLPKPPVPTVNASQVQAICIGGSVTLSANGCINGGTVKWTGGLTGASIMITPTTSRSYRASCLGTNGCASDSSAVLNIVVLPKTKPIITGPTFVCNDSPITLSATGCTGANETVMWRDQSVGLTYSDFITQTKTFRAVCIRNGYCISDSSDVFTVQYRTKPLQPTISAPPNTTVCQGTSLTLTASACTGGISNWTGGLVGNSINISAVGSRQYKVACTINGCTSDSSVAVLVTVKPKPGIPTISSSGNIVCEGQNVTLTASGCVDGSLSWTGGLTGQSIILSNVGLRSYKVACTINGCASDSSLVNAVQIKPKPATPTISANPSTTVCQGTTVTLSASACAGGTLNWTGGLTGNSIFITTVGSKNYKVACTVNGCKSDSSAAVLVTVNPVPIISLTTNKSEICAGENATLTVSGCTGILSWSNGAGNVASITVSPTIATNYIATCTLGSCSSIQQTTITLLQTPRVVASGPLVCDQSITLTAENYPSGATLQWRKDGVDIVGATNTTLVVNEAGNYDFVVGSLIELKKQVPKNSLNYNIKFLNKNIGFLSSNKIEKTIDGGNTWETKYTSINDAFIEIKFIDNAHGWAVSNSKILRTIDGGNNWIEYDMTSWGLAPSKISFMDTSNGIVIFYGGKTAYTTDGGVTWHLNSSIASTFNTIGIEYKNNVIICVSDFIWSGGGGGRVRKSIDKGLTWEIVKDIFFPCFSFKMVDNNLGFIGTYYGLFKTTDSGNTWIENTIPGSNWIRSISFINNQTGYMIDYDKIYKTTNGGGFWETYKSFPRDYNLYNQVDQKIEFIDENNGYFIQNAIDPNYIIQDYYIQLFKISTPQCPTTPAIVSPIPRPGGTLVINTFKSGAWTDASTWNCGFIPSSLDEVIINAGHTITDSGNLIQAKKVTFNGNGTLQVAPTTILKLGN